MATRRAPRADTARGRRPRRRAVGGRGLPRRRCVCAGASSASRSSSRSSTTSRSRATSQTRSTLNERAAEVQGCARSGPAAGAARRSATHRGARRARRGGIGLVRPGERLFIVKGIAEWRRAQAARSAATIGAMDDRALVERQLGRPPRAFRRVARPLPVRRAGRHRAGRRTTTTASRSRRRTTSRARTSSRRSRGSRRPAASSAGAPRSSDDRARGRPRARDARSSGGPAGARRRHGRRGRRRRRSSSGSAAARNPRRLKCLHAHVAFALAQPGYCSASGSSPSSSRSGRPTLLH